MADTWVELRVHGVSGTPPQSMLDVGRVEQIAGNEFGRVFHRFTQDGEAFRERDGHVIEAYHWGRFTSGLWTQALWLLLAPFGIVNAAQFTLEAPTSGFAKVCHTVAGAMLRLIGLALTVLFTLATATITMDLWAWQRVAASTGIPNFLAMLGATAVIGVCLLLGRSRLPSTPRTQGQPDASASLSAPDGPPSDLVRPGFFAGDPDAPALRRLHLAAGFTFVAMLGFAPGSDQPGSVARYGFWVALVVLGLVGVFIVFLGDPEQSASIAWRTRWIQRYQSWLHNQAKQIATWLAAAAAVVLATSLIHTLRTPPDRSTTMIHYPGIDWASYVTMLVTVTGLLVLALANTLLAITERHSPARSQNKRFAPYAQGFACTLFTSLGVFLGVGYAGAFNAAAAAAAALGDPDRGNPNRGIHVPELLSRVVYAWGIITILLVVLVMLGGVRRQLSQRKLRERAHTDFTREGGPRIPEHWISRVASAMWTARLKNSLVCLFITFAAVGLVLTVATAYELWPQLSPARSWPQLPDRKPQPLPGVLDWISQSETFGGKRPLVTLLMGLGTLTLTGFAATLIFLGRTAIRGESTRRGVNVVWDVIAFWPRSAHPFVPPAYSQHAVPDLENRIRWHLKELGHRPAGSRRRLVLCGHSQGSLLSFATLLRLTASPERHDVGLLTFGSQLQLAYSRGFPAYVNYETINYLFERLNGAWRNLYRDTDPLAGPVLSWSHTTQPDWFGNPEQPQTLVPPIDPEGRQHYGPDWRLLDPPVPADPTLQESSLSTLQGHSDYWKDDAWPAALTAVRQTPTLTT